tara:strand:+ start:408 stop:545 length:138 start_codon:yes stop_codon:yes gene_type:complete
LSLSIASIREIDRMSISEFRHFVKSIMLPDKKHLKKLYKKRLESL